MNNMNKVSGIVHLLGVAAALAAGQVFAADVDQPGLRVEEQVSTRAKLALGDRVQSFWNGLGDQSLPGGWSARLDTPASRLTASNWSNDLGSSDGLNLQRAALGNIYFSRFAGLRATGGVLGLSRSTAGRLLASGGPQTPLQLDRPGSITGFEGPAQALPYLGLGYSSRWLTGPTSAASTWGVSADLGLMAASPRSAVRLGQQGLDDTLRELRLAPMLQFGVSYTY
ncbi:MAG: hypothetical protein RL375_4875 [Pseudomonadota bacterium]